MIVSTSPDAEKGRLGSPDTLAAYSAYSASASAMTPATILDSQMGKRTPLEPIPGYYPQVVDEKTFDAVQSLLRQRNSRRTGGPSSKHVNIFKGLLFDETGEPYFTYRRASGATKGQRYLAPYGARLGTQQEVNLRQTVFEGMFFDVMLGQFPTAFLPPKDETPTEMDGLTSELAATEGKIATIQEQVLSANSSAKIASVVALLEKLERQKTETEQKIQDLRGKSVLTDADRMRKVFDTFRTLVKGELGDEGREDLAAALRQLLKRITLIMGRNGKMIEGRCSIEPLTGDDILFTFSYDPYTNDKRKSPLERARWEVQSSLSLP